MVRNTTIFGKWSFGGGQITVPIFRKVRIKQLVAEVKYINFSRKWLIKDSEIYWSHDCQKHPWILSAKQI